MTKWKEVRWYLNTEDPGRDVMLFVGLVRWVIKYQGLKPSHQQQQPEMIG